jgi:hypothetical protein
MASPRRRAFLTGDRPHGCGPHVWHVLTDSACTCIDRGEPFFEDMPELWRRHRRSILADWILRHPGTRPTFWWALDAPEPRRQLSGRQCKSYPAVVPTYIRGIPADIEIDEADPPVYETERAYLERHSLLEPGE